MQHTAVEFESRNTPHDVSWMGAPDYIPTDVVALCAKFTWGDDPLEWNESMFAACTSGQLELAQWLDAKIEAEWQATVRRVAMAGQAAFVEWVTDIEFDWNCMDQMNTDQPAWFGTAYQSEDRYAQCDSSMLAECNGNHMGVADMLCGMGATDWDDVLQCACDSNQLEVAKWARERGATDIDRGLSTACWRGFMDVARWAVAQGASGLDEGLKYACQYDQLPVAEWLKEQGATKFAEALEHVRSCGASDTDTTRWLESLCE